MARRTLRNGLVALALGLVTIPQFAARAQTREESNMSKVRVRYMVNALDPAVKFYTAQLGFKVERESQPNFALLERGNLELVLSTPFGPGGAAKPMPDGRKAEPGGWNRIIIDVADLQAEVARLKEAHQHFRNEVVSGPGGSEILVDDPSGNPVELFQPAK
jgi:catechol 2,3-dioxygenase-like lactoylglutathione lyase family enzyme